MTTKNQSELKNLRNLFLDSLEINGFKSIKSATVQLAPITVLLGGNSSGKSSVIQSILLACQNTLRRFDTSIDFNGPAVTLGTHGDVRHRGMKKDEQISLKYNFAGTGNFSIFEGTGTSIEFELGQDGSSLDSRRSTVPISACSITMKIPGKKAATLTSKPISSQQDKDSELEKRIFSISGDFFTSGMFNPMKTNEYNRYLNSTGTKVSKVNRKEINILVEADSRGSFFPTSRFVSRDFQVETEKWRILIAAIATLKNSKLSSETKLEYESINNELQARLNKTKHEYHFLSRTLEKFFSCHDDFKLIEDIRSVETFLAIKKLVEIMNRGDFSRQETRLEQLLDENPDLAGFEASKLQEIICGVVVILKDEKSAFTTLDFSRNEIFTPAVQPYFDNASVVEEALSNYLMTSVHYLGPLRAHSLADQSGWSPRSALIPFGVRGEGLGAVLDSPQARRKMTYPLPPASKGAFSSEVKRVSLIDALNAWVNWFSLGSKVDVDDQGAYGSHLQLDLEKMFQKGTGVSQLLPVLALSLRARPGSLVMIEQPELHLHPALQQRLGTFFALLAKTNRRFIVETHSEYIVTRLRREVAVGKIASNYLGLLFVNSRKTITNFNLSTFKNAPVSDSGVVSNWPEGFFDFTSDDKLDILIATRARQKETKA